MQLESLVLISLSEFKSLIRFVIHLQLSSSPANLSYPITDILSSILVFLKSPYVGVKQKLLQGGLSLVNLFSQYLSTFYKIPLCGCETKIVMRALVSRDFRDMKPPPCKLRIEKPLNKMVKKARVKLGDLHILDSDS